MDAVRAGRRTLEHDISRRPLSLDPEIRFCDEHVLRIGAAADEDPVAGGSRVDGGLNGGESRLGTVVPVTVIHE